MKLDDARITILVDQNRTTIELHDRKSGITFAEITLTPEQLSAALSRIAYTECEIRIQRTDILNKKLEVDKITFELPPGFYKYNEEDTLVLHQLANKACPEGWSADTYYGSRDSFFEKNGKKYACCTIRRWV